MILSIRIRMRSAAISLCLLCVALAPFAHGQKLSAEEASKMSWRSPLMVVLGEQDEFARPELVMAQEARMRDLRVSHRLIRYEGGHAIDPDVLQMVAHESEV